MRHAFRLALAAGLVCLVACGRTPDADDSAAPPPARAAAPAAAGAPAAAATPPPAAAPGTPATPVASASAGNNAGDAIADAYACDAGTRLTRQDDGSFRAEIPGNAPIRLARIAGSAPPVFTGASLYLRIEGSGVAILSQGDRTNELRCAASHAPA